MQPTRECSTVPALGQSEQTKPLQDRADEGPDNGDGAGSNRNPDRPALPPFVSLSATMVAVLLIAYETLDRGSDATLPLIEVSGAFLIANLLHICQV